MAEDEQRHAGVLERSRRLRDLQQTAPQASDRVFHDIEQQLTAAEEAISHAGIGVDEALRYAMLLESSEIDRLDQAWFHAFPPSLETLLLLLTPEDNLHCDASSKPSTPSARTKRSMSRRHSYG
jgi:hypothetical protein